MKILIVVLFVGNAFGAATSNKQVAPQHHPRANIYGYKYDEAKLQHIFNNKKDRTYILSYPRSGNTWMRYCLEWLTKRPSFSRFNLKHHVNFPLGWTSGFEIDINKPGLEKVHTAIELQRTNANDKTESLIFIVRNPKEVLIRHIGKVKLVDAMSKAETPEYFQIYFDALKIFEEWRSPRKILIYYEDFIQMPTEVLSSLLDFLHEPADSLPAFLKQFEDHRKKCLQVYKDSKSNGTEVLFHSKSLTPEERRQIDEWVQRKEPTLWSKFLKDRYAER